MYSVVLVMALAGGAEAPDCHCHNYCGCSGVSYGCQGASYGCYGTSYGCGGAYGGAGYGTYGYPGGGYYQGRPVEKSGERIAEPKKGIEQANGPMPATILVSLPANAKLTIDGYVSNQTSSQRRLVTPAIEPGQEFTYTLVAQTIQNGQVVSETQRVTVRGGQETPVNFTFSAIPVPANR